MKWASIGKTSIQEQLITQAARIQATLRSGLLKQIAAIMFLLQQGIALRGHTEEEGNLSQLLAVWSEDNANVRDWMKERKFMSHDIVNELITLMGLKVLRQL